MHWRFFQHFSRACAGGNLYWMHCRLAARQTEKLREVADKGELTEPITTTEPDQSGSKSVEGDTGVSVKTKKEYLLSLAESSPRGAILESWLLVDSELRRLAQRNGIEASPKKVPVSKLLWELNRAHLTTPEVLEVSGGLNRLRNEAVHETEIEITQDKAIEFITLVLRVLNYLDVNTIR